MIEAGQGLVIVSEVTNLRLTFEELFAGVFLEDGFVNNGSAKIVNHQADDGQDFFFRVPSITRQKLILFLG